MSTTLGPRQRVVVLNTVLALLSVGTLAWNLPAAIRFAAAAPAQFWVLAALALVVDAPMFVGRRADLRGRATLSPAVCFAIFVLWGASPAIVVQAVALAVTLVGQRSVTVGTAFFSSRILLALASADIVVSRAEDHPAPREGALTGADILWILKLAAVWFVVAYGLVLLLGLVGDPKGLRASAEPIRDDLLVSGVALLLATPLLVALPGWWNMVVALPLLLWSLSLRLRTREEQRLLREAQTGLLNRRGLRTQVNAITIHDAFRVQPFAVVMVHANEAIPDLSSALGRDLYERVVVHFAERMARAYGAHRVARLVGEGFVILVTDREAEDPVALGRDAARLLSEPAEVNGIPFRFHCATGIALSPEHGRDIDALLVKAEHAITTAHREDRTVVVYVPDTEAQAQRRITLLSEMYSMLCDPARADELRVVYQPQVELGTGRLIGAEALLRWTHPEWGPVPVNDLIEAIETSEVMHLLTRHVLEIAVTQVRAWNDQGLRMRVSVNASAQDLKDEEFPEEISATLAAHGVRPDQLTIEVTERMVLAANARVSRAAVRIVDLGVGLSIDDFGTGFASMQQLQTLPVTEVKIDKSYVDGMLSIPSRHAIVTSVHQLGLALGLNVVAEGVEDEATALALARLGGVIGQGYYFGRPMAPDALIGAFASLPPDGRAPTAQPTVLSADGGRRRESPRRWSRRRW